MSAIHYRVVFLIAAFTIFSQPADAQNMRNYLNKYFKGSAIQFAFGAGVSSSRPRVELFVQYCASGIFYSNGRSCRPNVVAQGYQCTPIKDSGGWNIVVQGRQAMLSWRSHSGRSGGVALRVRRDGIVVDPQGNAFKRVGRARCR